VIWQEPDERLQVIDDKDEPTLPKNSTVPAGVVGLLEVSVTVTVQVVVPPTTTVLGAQVTDVDVV
jgi:hypothetical protein